MGLIESVGEIEVDLFSLKEVIRQDFEVRLRSQTGREDLNVGSLEAYDWKRNSPLMHITFRGSELGYIFPVQRVAFLFHNTATTLVEPLSRTFLDTGYKCHTKDMWKEAYSILQHEAEFQSSQNLISARGR